MHYCLAEDGQIVVLVTDVDDTLHVRDYEEKVQGIAIYLLGRYKGRNLGVPDKLLGMARMVSNKKKHRTPRATSLGMEFFDVLKVSTPFDPRMDHLCKGTIKN